jgi:omega-6 fatty acid desaturase (delta-12 desaturase)
MPSVQATLRDRSGSLNDVRAAIPAACYQRSARRAAVALAQALVLWVAPLVALALTHRWWLILPLWVLAGLGVTGLFVIGHDASHGALLDSRRLNRVVAHLCMAPSAHVEAAWDLGHNRIHHGYTTRQGFDFVWHPLTPQEYRKLGALARLRHRVEWSFVGSGAYFLRAVWWEKMWRSTVPGARRGPINRDKAVLVTAVVLVVGATATAGALTGGWLTAVWLPLKLFIVPFLIFVHVIGWAVYVHHVAPDIRWWAKREWTQFHGQMDSTTILHMPRWMNRLWFHNIFVHVAHHVDTRIPFHKLPAAADAIVKAYPDTVRSGRLSLRKYVQTTRLCKLYDFEAGRWLGYSAARS